MIYRNIIPQFIDAHACKFTVWAPEAKNITLVFSNPERIIPLKHQEYGFWAELVKNVSPGMQYKYKINDGDAFPDPASLSQPNGVHGPSEVINLNEYNWKDANWKGIPLDKMIQYELHTGTFTEEGTFNGIVSKLDYLLELGINTIEILPVSQFSGHRNWGYDGVYPFAVQSTYGGAKELMKLVDTCHQKGIAVVLDVVYNHFGPEGNYVSNFGHYFTVKYSTPWGDAINYDDRYSDGVRNYVVQNVLMWLRDFHIDALRLDAIHAIFDFSATHILKELADNVNLLSKSTNRMYHLIAESHLNDVRYISSSQKGGYDIDAQWSDDFHHSVHALATGENNGYYFDFGQPSHLVKAFKDAFVFDGKYSEFRKQTYGNTTENNPGKQFVIFNQNHDQVGNRKFGERLISLTDFETAKLIAGTMFVAPNVPMLFMGEEYGERNPFLYFVSHESKELNELVRKGRQQEFKDFYTDKQKAPDPSSKETFENSKLSWNIQQDPEKQAMFVFYKTLINLRQNHPVLKVTNKNNLKSWVHEKAILLERWENNQKLFAVMNYGDREVTIKIPESISGPLDQILDSTDKKYFGKEGIARKDIKSGDELTVQEKSIVIYSNNTK
ncbi:MAG: malto-oligosyltrehalose trehalohydrolase [Bacteroidota bacterium]